jgi:hypothetical protein
MSALPLKADIADCNWDVRLCQKRPLPRRLQGFQKRDEVAFLLVRETEIETLVVKFDDV